MQNKPEVKIFHALYYRYEEGECEEVRADPATFLKEHPVGTVYRVHAGAPGTGYTDYRVTRHDADGVYGVVIHSTVRQLTLEDVR